jgi:hypothetical protein
MTIEEIRNKLATAVTTYDRKQSGKRFYNPYALGQYLARVAEVAADIERGAAVRPAIIAGFTGPLCNAVLRSVGESKALDSERSTSWTYCPITEGESNDGE